MATITPGNRLYLYQLLSRELGAGRQTLISRVDEVLSADGLAPADLDCSDAQELLEGLDFVKLTVFKGGRVYATVMPDDAADQLLAATDNPADNDKAKGKPWKRRGAKSVRPVKPRHIVTEEPAAAPAPVEPVVETPSAAPVREQEACAPEVLSAKPEPEQPAEPEPTPPAPQEVPTAELETPPAEPVAAAAPPTTPSINLTITYNPYEEMERDLRETLTSAAEPSEAAAPEPESEPRPIAPVHVIQSDLPQHFSEDVIVRDGPLSVLYQNLPLDVEPMAVLDEDWRVSRSTGTFEGTRSTLTFPLRYLRKDGQDPITVTLRRSAKAMAGKRWSVDQVNVDGETTDTSEVPGFDGVEKRDEGAWTDLSGASRASLASSSPIREFTQFALIGTWDGLLSELARIAVPERWDYPSKSNHAILREYVTVTFHRIVHEGKLAVAAGESFAAFDTGLLTVRGEDVYACFSAHEGDIPWAFSGFCVVDEGELGMRLARTFDELPLPARYVDETTGLSPLANVTVSVSPTVRRRFSQPIEEQVARLLRRAGEGRGVAAPAYDPADETIKLLLPFDGRNAVVVASRGDGSYEVTSVMPLERARVCARVVSAAVPSWLG